MHWDIMQLFRKQSQILSSSLRKTKSLHNTRLDQNKPECECGSVSKGCVCLCSAEAWRQVCHQHTRAGTQWCTSNLGDRGRQHWSSGITAPSSVLRPPASVLCVFISSNEIQVTAAGSSALCSPNFSFSFLKHSFLTMTRDWIKGLTGLCFSPV